MVFERVDRIDRDEHGFNRLNTAKHSWGICLSRYIVRAALVKYVQALKTIAVFQTC